MKVSHVAAVLDLEENWEIVGGHALLVQNQFNFMYSIIINVRSNLQILEYISKTKTSTMPFFLT